MSESIDESKNNPEFRRALSDQGAFPGLKIMKNDLCSNSKWSQMKIKRLPWQRTAAQRKNLAVFSAIWYDIRVNENSAGLSAETVHA